MNWGWEQEFVDFREEVKGWVGAIVDDPTVAAARKKMQEDPEGGNPASGYLRDKLDEKGWLKMCWPPELGGEGKSPWFQYILGNEMSVKGIPFSLGTAMMIGPAISMFGTDQQKEEFLPGLWSGDIVAALGYSEPNAGTDLASLQTRAVKDGDDWVINGQKIWTSGAHTSTHVWLATRTDPDAPKHRGISMLIVPMDVEGITVRPIMTMSGFRTNEVFFEDVRVPNHSLIGEENRGWYIAANALDHERVTLGSYLGQAMQFQRLLNHLATDPKQQLKDPQERLRLAEAKIDVHISRALGVTNAAIVANGGTPTMEASMLKIWTSEFRFEMADLGMNMFGRYGALRAESDLAPLKGEFDDAYRASPILRFGGGTNEVQRNIIAQRGLGLPR